MTEQTAESENNKRDKNIRHIESVVSDMPYEKMCVIDFLCDLILHSQCSELTQNPHSGS